MMGYNALEGTFLGGCLFSGRVAGRAAAAASDGARAASPRETCKFCQTRPGESFSSADQPLPSPPKGDLVSTNQPSLSLPPRCCPPCGSASTGGAGSYFLVGLGSALLTIFTFNLATPWAICMYFRWAVQHTTVNGQPVRFTGTGLGAVRAVDQVVAADVRHARDLLLLGGPQPDEVDHRTDRARGAGAPRRRRCRSERAWLPPGANFARDRSAGRGFAANGAAIVLSG